ncbi:uncharacterized protein LOC127750726 [Frankliniella occidentalis]|uniref:Uncharacterized protein LOC127750726 n=1 Tax=Frankliniella occidentalis TaxID=133901 RepID=A0A9C6X4M7_FRAOC|nr:uncharacterized protein LOC127750726 [Frankliniella occidentalis]
MSPFPPARLEALLLVLAALLRLAVATLSPTPRAPCVTAGFLSHVLAAHKHVLLAQIEHPVLCHETLGKLHGVQATTIEMHRHGIAVNRPAVSLRYCDQPIDVVVILMGSRDDEIAMVLRTLKHVKRSTPVLAVLSVNCTDTSTSDAEGVVQRLINDRWWKISVALQLVNAEDSPVPVYSSALSLLPGVSCSKNWSPTALEFVWTPGSTLPLQALEKSPPLTNLRGCVVNVAYGFSPPFVFWTAEFGLFGVDFDLAEFFAYGSNASIQIIHNLDHSTGHTDHLKES